MILPYNELNSKTIELANLTEENIKLGVSSTPLKLIPSFIMPDNSIYYMTTDHFSANFYEEIEMAFNVIGQKPNMSLIKMDIKETLKKLRNDLITDYQKFKINNISTGDVRAYLNMNCLEMFNYDARLQGLYSPECKEVLLMLLNSKIQIYDYFLNLGKVFEQESKKELDFTWKTEQFIQDFAVLSIGIDKIETMFPKTITTTKLNPYEYYFNYLLMDYNIVQLPRVIFDKREKKFITIVPNDYSMASYYDEGYKQELELIKKKVPKMDRKKYFL